MRTLRLVLLFKAMRSQVDILLILTLYGSLILGTVAWSIHLLCMALPTCVSLLCPSRRFHLLLVIFLHEVVRIGSRMQIYF